MRSIPVDAARINFVGTGKTSPKMEYVELSDGSRRASGNQARDVDGTGLPLWVLDVVADDDDARRAEVVAVTVAAAQAPECPKWRPVDFAGLVATIYTDRASGQIRTSLKAEKVLPPARPSVVAS